MSLLQRFAMEAKSYQPGMVVTQQMLSILLVILLVVNKIERKAYAAMTLTVDSSVMTAIGNDYGYDEVFARQVERVRKRRGYTNYFKF